MTDVELLIDMNVKITGGKYKHCVGVLKEINKSFCKVELTRNEKKEETFQPVKLQKVKKAFVLPHPEPLIVEMPKQEDLKVVEHFPDEKPDLLNYIDEAMKDKEINNNLVESVEPEPEPEPEVEGVIDITGQVPSIDEAMELKQENKKLKECLATYDHYNINDLIKELSSLRVDYEKLFNEYKKICK